ncbi:hypothetical protein QJQ45_004811 [Haematococcus lacustris]|nr:hypothetical protein QJQ45_004811 [Haematococcus lacustris]
MDMGCGGGDGGGGGGSLPQVLEDPKWPAQWPFKPSDFQRYDEQPDTQFYSQPRFVTHIDDYAISALTKHYAQRFPPSGTPGTALLDICSSWVSHYPDGYKADKVSGAVGSGLGMGLAACSEGGGRQLCWWRQAGTCRAVAAAVPAGLGMNADELKRNPQLTDWLVADLNKDPKLPYPDNTFDVVTNVVSVDYLNKPLEVFREMHRVLKPGGTAMMSFSNRCFPTKAIQLWTATADPDHVWIVGAYFHYSVPGGFTAPTAADISPKLGFRSDPILFLAFCIVYSMRPSGTSLKLSAWPSPAWLYAQAALTLLTKPKSSKTTQSKGRGFKILQVAVTKPTPCCPQRLAAFLQLAGFNSSQGPLPLSYPIVEAFRLVIQAMLLPDFPFNVLGSVLARNTTTVYRAMTAEQPLIYRLVLELAPHPTPPHPTPPHPTPPHPTPPHPTPPHPTPPHPTPPHPTPPHPTPPHPTPPHPTPPHPTPPHPTPPHPTPPHPTPPHPTPPHPTPPHPTPPHPTPPHPTPPHPTPPHPTPPHPTPPHPTPPHPTPPHPTPPHPTPPHPTPPHPTPPHPTPPHPTPPHPTPPHPTPPHPTPPHPTPPHPTPPLFWLVRYSVQIDTGACRTTAKGHVEVDLVCQAVSAADGVAVWRSTTTVIILGSKRGQQPPSSTAGAEAAAKSDAPSGGSQRQVVATWQLSSSTGRSYGLLNGDLNPIHLYPATSRLFGFKRPIAHALFLVARAEASLRQQGVQPLSYPVALTADFKRPTLLPASLQFAWDPPTSAASAMSAGGQGVQFAVLTQDGGKEVLTGALRPVA